MSKRISRREFVGQSLAAGTAMTLGAALPLRALAGAQTGYDLAVVKGDMPRAVKAAIDTMGGIGRFVKRGQRVVLKPNMSFPNPPEWGSTTHPDIVRAVAKLCLDAGASRVAVIDQPLRRPEVCLRRSGIAAACADLSNVTVVALSEQKFYQKVSVPDGKQLREVEVARDALQADVLINIPVAKSHNATGVSFGMKNLMGLIWDREYFHQFVDLNQAVADLSTRIRPDLIIVDATRPMTTAGPNGPGKVVQLDKIVAGIDPVAVDAYTVGLTSWYGQTFAGRNVKHIQAASELGLGEMDVSRLRIRELTV